MVAFKSVSIALVSMVSLQAYAASLPASPKTGLGSRSSCDTLIERKEWRAMDRSGKAAYIDAVKCLQSRPALNPAISAARTRFDEFQAYHIAIADGVHVVGHFLPWHRYFLILYEQALRNECGYEGANPYWDWSQDADSDVPLVQSSIWDPETGFGGDGVPGTYTVPPDPTGTNKIASPAAYVGCIGDGPFAGYTLRCGPGKMVTDHCITRGINETTKMYLNSAAVARATSMPTFEEFRTEMEGQPITADHRTHDGGHVAVGGELSNFYSSPGDPIFYLHHANLDRIWQSWQEADSSRLFEISGPDSPVPPSQNVTLEYILQMGTLGSSIPIRDVMDIHNSPGCYTYI